jgi:hypothetical protein
MSPETSSHWRLHTYKHFPATEHMLILREGGGPWRAQKVGEVQRRGACVV